MRTTINFDQVSINRMKSGRCRCGKLRVRRKTFSQTLNPFNTNKDGATKTRDEIRSELDAEANAWKKEPITCADCE